MRKEDFKLFLSIAACAVSVFGLLFALIFAAIWAEAHFVTAAASRAEAAGDIERIRAVGEALSDIVRAFRE